MPRHTIESTRETLTDLREQKTVYKVDVDALWNAFRTAFEQDWKLIQRVKHLDLPHGSPSEADTSLYFTAPNEVRHWFGNKFSKFLDELPSSDFKDSTIRHRHRWRPLYQTYLDLKARQIKGRKPAEPKKVVGTRTQMRAICPCCFKEHAVSGDTMVAHGYTLDYGFQNGTCRGAGKSHFGTVAGRVYTSELIKELRNEAAQTVAAFTFTWFLSKEV